MSIKSSYSFSIDRHIHQWLEHRQQVLSSYSQLCSPHQTGLETVEEFCQLLIDYISFGHFKMFEKLAEAHESYQPKSQGLDKNLLHKISKTTDIALDFNAKYTKPKSLEALSADLSSLGESLADRIEWEDELIKAYS